MSKNSAADRAATYSVDEALDLSLRLTTETASPPDAGIRVAVSVCDSYSGSPLREFERRERLVPLSPTTSRDAHSALAEILRGLADDIPVISDALADIAGNLEELGAAIPIGQPMRSGFGRDVPWPVLERAAGGEWVQVGEVPRPVDAGSEMVIRFSADYGEILAAGRRRLDQLVAQIIELEGSGAQVLSRWAIELVAGRIGEIVDEWISWDPWRDESAWVAKIRVRPGSSVVELKLCYAGEVQTSTISVDAFRVAVGLDFMRWSS